MQFWDDMNDKYGFNDGQAIPVEIEKYREVYIIAMNTLLERFSSNIRVVAYDRPGWHNWCLIVRVNVNLFNTMSKEEILSGNVSPDNEPFLDESFENALMTAYELELDSFLEVTVSINKEDLFMSLNNE